MDSKTKVIHAVAATAANMHDATCLPDLLHGDETRVWATRPTRANARLFASMPGWPWTSPTAVTATRTAYLYEVQRAKNKIKSSVRAKVEHASFVLKRVFGFVKTRYRGREKNAHRLFVSCACESVHDAQAVVAELGGVV